MSRCGHLPDDSSGYRCALSYGHGGPHAEGDGVWGEVGPARKATRPRNAGPPAWPVPVRRRTPVEQLQRVSERLVELASDGLRGKPMPGVELFGLAAAVQVIATELAGELEDACPDDPDGLHHTGCGCDDADLGWGS